ncbi:MAG: diguanylate cyclase [Acidobacteriales bacterium]|nr:diguanylate cyclase [Terriglobales bacterium]
MKVLVADDSVIDRHILESSLRKWSYETVTACDGIEAWELLQRPDAPRLAVLDWMMPGLTGVEICQRLRREIHNDYTYVLLLTSRSEREDLVEGMDSGADDYIRKPFDNHELEVRLRAGRRIVELQAELVAAREALRVQATTDPLTRIWNRGSITEILEKEIHRARRERSYLGVVLVDLDHFKTVNDTHGHLAGDAVLHEAVRRMQACMRPYDSIGRYGGEEFLIVLPGCDAGATVEHAERLRIALSSEAMNLAESGVILTASFGCTVVAPDAQPTFEQVVHCADEALYKAKDSGRNAVGLVTPLVALAQSR